MSQGCCESQRGRDTEFSPGQSDFLLLHEMATAASQLTCTERLLDARHGCTERCSTVTSFKPRNIHVGGKVLFIFIAQMRTLRARGAW